MAKKKKQYSLQDYIAGVSLDDFEIAQEAQSENDSSDTTKFHLAAEMDKLWQKKYSANFASKHYLYYKHLDDLVLQAQKGDEDAIKEIVAFSLHSFQPHAMARKYCSWHSIGEDDFCQVVCLATLEAIQRYTFDIVGFNNFAGYLKSWVTCKLKETQVVSSPIVQKNKKERKEHPFTYVLIDGFSGGEDDDGFDIADSKDDYTSLEENELFVEMLKSLPNRIGEVLILYYGLESPLSKKKTLLTKQRMRE